MLDYIFSWNTLFWLLMLLYVPACLGLIFIVLLQKGKGVGFAGAFGAGTGAETVFGPRTSRSLPQRITYTMAALFMFLALVLSLISGRVGRGSAPELLDESAFPAAAETEELNELFDENAAPAEGVTVNPAIDGNMVTIPAPDSVSESSAITVSPSSGEVPSAAPAPEAVPVATPSGMPVDAGVPRESVVPPPVSIGGNAAVPSLDAPAEDPAAEAPAAEAPAEAPAAEAPAEAAATEEAAQ